MNDLLLASAALQFLTDIIPVIDARVASGEVPAEKQAELQAQISVLRTKLDSISQQPHWQITE